MTFEERFEKIGKPKEARVKSEFEKAREFWFVHTEGDDQVENCFVLKSAYIKEKEAKERVLRVLKEARYALYRLKIGVKWDENHEWFGEVYKEAEKQLEAGK